MILTLLEWDSKTANEKQQFLISNRYLLKRYIREDKKKPPTHIKFEKYDNDVKIVI